MALPKTRNVAALDLADSGRERSGNMPATRRKAIVQSVANAANQSSEIQFGSMAFMTAPALGWVANDWARRYSASATNPAACRAMAAFCVREGLRILVLTKRVS